MTVFLMLVGGILVMAQSILELQTESEEARYIQGREDALDDLLRKNFLTLPASTTFELSNKQGNSTLILREAPLAFNFGQGGSDNEEVVLEITSNHSEKQLLLTRRVDSSKEKNNANSDINNTGNSLPLLWEMEEISIEFYDDKSNQWTNTWNKEQGRPRLLKFNLLAPQRDPLEIKLAIAPLIEVDGLENQTQTSNDQTSNPSRIDELDDETPPDFDETEQAGAMGNPESFGPPDFPGNDSNITNDPAMDSNF